MTDRAPNRPGKAEQWATRQRKITIHLQPSDQIFFRFVNTRGIPAGVGAVNAGKTCTVIIGHKEIGGGLEKVRSFRDLEEFAGSSVEILPADLVFSSGVDNIGAPFSVGKENKGKDVTIIVHVEEPEEEKN
jgi:hypothetical protein